MYKIFEHLLQIHGVTAYKVSKATGVTQTSLSNWKSGRNTPSIHTLQKIADYFNVSLEYLTTGKEKEGGETYYLNDETAKIAQEIFTNKELLSLFNLLKKMPSERLQSLIDFLSFEPL